MYVATQTLVMPKCQSQNTTQAWYIFTEELAVYTQTDHKDSLTPKTIHLNHRLQRTPYCNARFWYIYTSVLSKAHCYNYSRKRVGHEYIKSKSSVGDCLRIKHYNIPLFILAHALYCYHYHS